MYQGIEAVGRTILAPVNKSVFSAVSVSIDKHEKICSVIGKASLAAFLRISSFKDDGMVLSLFIDDVFLLVKDLATIGHPFRRSVQGSVWAST
jgi:hypothetical protein